MFAVSRVDATEGLSAEERQRREAAARTRPDISHRDGWLKVKAQRWVGIRGPLQSRTIVYGRGYRNKLHRHRGSALAFGPVRGPEGSAERSVAKVNQKGRV